MKMYFWRKHASPKSITVLREWTRLDLHKSNWSRYRNREENDFEIAEYLAYRRPVLKNRPFSKTLGWIFRPSNESCYRQPSLSIAYRARRKKKSRENIRSLSFPPYLPFKSPFSARSWNKILSKNKKNNKKKEKNQRKKASTLSSRSTKTRWLARNLEISVLFTRYKSGFVLI